MKNTFSIIDSHCHIYPDKIAAKASKGISDFYDGLQTRFDGSLGKLYETGAAAGIDRYVVHSVAVTAGKAASINRYIAETVQNSNGKLIGLGTLHPDSRDVEGDIKQIKQLGLKGVKLHADVQRVAINDPRCYKIYEILQGDLPVLLHTGDNRYNYSNPENLIPVLKTFKNLTVIGAHFGGWSVWEEAARTLSRFENLYVDTSSTFGCTSVEFVRRLLPRYDVNRVLFGSDYPMWNAAEELDALFSLGLSEEQYKKILYENAERLTRFNSEAL